MPKYTKSLPLVALVATVAFAGVNTGVAAQDARIRQQHTVIVPHEFAAEIQRLVHHAVAEDLSGDVSRDISRAMHDVSGALSHFSGAAWAREQDRDFRAEQTDRQTRTLSIGATGALELKNVVGDITVKTGGARDVSVEIVRVSRGRTDADAKLGLERVTTEVTARDDRASISVRYSDERRPPYSVSVAYNVTAPAGTRLSIHSVTGQVKIAGAKGEMSVNTVSGDVGIASAGHIASAHTVSGKLVITDAQSDAAIDAGTVSGSIALANLKARRLSVNSVSGDIAARDIQAGGADLRSISGRIEYSGTVAPTGRYEFRTHSGEIRLGLTGGFDFEGGTFSGRVDAEAGLGLTATSGTRSTMRGAVGNGGAVVEATTFSGNVKVGRKLD